MVALIISVVCGVLGLIVAAIMAAWVLKQDEGSKSVKAISEAVKEGATAFLRREYTFLAIFVVVVAIILAVVPNLGWQVMVAFVFGAICSGLTGYIGMNIAVRANRRTTAAAQRSLNQGLKVSFRAGSVMGMSVVSVGIIGLTIIYFAFNANPNFLFIIPGFGMGASSVAIFARVGGGIFTKAADTGADIVGKVEQGIPEDDPRNAAVIADFVGDNVGDVAGMGADLFESYVDSIIATTILATIAVFSTTLGKALVPDQTTAFFLPMLVASGGIIASIIGIFVVRVGEQTKIGALLNALRKGTWSSTVISAILSFIVVYFSKADLGVYWAILAGLIAGVLIGESANYFTSYDYKPTRNVAESSQTGAGTLVTRGFANGLMSTIPPVILVVIGILVAYKFADIYGVAIAGIGLLATLGIQNATDAYGPIADNAGGLAEMAGLPHEVREKTDALDALGNTTAATGKGFAIGGAGLTALALLLSYTTAADIKFAEISLMDPKVIAGLLLGGLFPAVFCALTLNSVGKTAMSIINEVRRQFREIKGLKEGAPGVKPDYSRAVTMCTTAAVKQMIAPGLITILLPIIIGIILGPVALGGFLIGTVVTGFILAVAFSNAGGSWDNAKKYIEAGNLGGKGSDAHKAAVVGDTVGDPMKDTSGPSLNIMIKLATIIAVVIAPAIAHFTGLI